MKTTKLLLLSIISAISISYGADDNTATHHARVAELVASELAAEDTALLEDVIEAVVESTLHQQHLLENSISRGVIIRRALEEAKGGRILAMEATPAEARAMTSSGNKMKRFR